MRFRSSAEPPPKRLGVDVDEAAAAQPLGQAQQELDRAPRRDVAVGVEAGGDHRVAPPASASSQS